MSQNSELDVILYIGGDAKPGDLDSIVTSTWSYDVCHCARMFAPLLCMQLELC